MQTSAKTMTACTAVSLLAVTTYSIALGSNGLLWFAWVVLGLATLGVIVTSEA